MVHIANALINLVSSSSPCPPSVIIQALSKMLSDKDFVSYMSDEYFKYLGKTSIKKVKK